MSGNCCRVIFFYIILFQFYLYNGKKSKIIGNNKKNPAQITNGKFIVVNKKITWWDAVSYCTKKGMRIGEVMTVDDAHQLTRMMLKIRPSAIETAWIGGYMNSSMEDTSWKWLSTQEKIADDSELWLKKSQINGNSDSKLESFRPRCLLLDRHLESKPGYITATCDRQRGFICEIINSTIPTINNKRFNSTINSTGLTDREINVETTLSTVIKSSKHSSSLLPSPTTVSTYYTEAMAATKINSIITIKKENKINPEINCSPAVSPDEEYSDYKLWEFGKREMKMKKKQIAEKNARKFSSLTHRRANNFRKMKIHKSREKLRTTVEPEIELHTARIPLEPLKPYYAFEGPMVGGLTATPLPQTEHARRTKLIPVPHYQKYISRKKFNKLLLEQSIVKH